MSESGFVNHETVSLTEERSRVCSNSTKPFILAIDKLNTHSNKEGFPPTPPFYKQYSTIEVIDLRILKGVRYYQECT